jgi:hypothetical protein
MLWQLVIFVITHSIILPLKWCYIVSLIEVMTGLQTQTTTVWFGIKSMTSSQMLTFISQLTV